MVAHAKKEKPQFDLTPKDALRLSELRHDKKFFKSAQEHGKIVSEFSNSLISTDEAMEKFNALRDETIKHVHSTVKLANGTAVSEKEASYFYDAHAWVQANPANHLQYELLKTEAVTSKDFVKKLKTVFTNNVVVKNVTEFNEKREELYSNYNNNANELLFDMASAAEAAQAKIKECLSEFGFSAEQIDHVPTAKYSHMAALAYEIGKGQQLSK